MVKRKGMHVAVREPQYPAKVKDVQGGPGRVHNAVVDDARDDKWVAVGIRDLHRLKLHQ